VVFDGGTAAAQQLEIGSGSFIAGFEDGLVGVKPGETVDLNLTFPAVYHNAELAGQAVVFTVTVNFIYPAEENWSDDVVAAAANPDFATVEEMKQYVYDYLEEYNAYYYDINLENAVVEAFINQCEFKEVPEELIQSYRDDFTLTMGNEAAMYGMDVDSLCYYYYGVDLATFLDTYVTESAKQSLAFQAVANAENMNLSDADFDARLMELATQYGCTTIEQYIGANPKEGYRELFMLEDVVAFLVENATVKQPE
jgi:trigger factor